MKKHQLKRIYACLPSGMAFIIPIAIGMMFSVTAKAQIVYTDLIPDVWYSCTFNSPCTGNYSLDLNNDGINDFVLSPRKKFVGCGACHSLIYVMADGDSVVISSTSNSWIADQAGGYALNTLIDSSLGWTNAIHTLATKRADCVACSSSPGNYLVQSPISGPWVNIWGKYLGLKIQMGTDFYYGWIKLGVAIGSNTVSITIMEYAYNSSPSQPILAGQKIVTGITENYSASSITLYPNPAKDHLTIDLGSINKKVEVTIADITGKVIYKTSVFAPDSYREQKIEVSTKDFTAGVYLLQIQTADFIGTEKLVIQK